jgi:hypothetical protein
VIASNLIHYRTNGYDEIQVPHNVVHIEQVSGAEDPVNAGRKVEIFGTDIVIIADSVV